MTKMSDNEKWAKIELQATIIKSAAKMTELEYQEHTKRMLMGIFPFRRVFEKWINILQNIESHP
jgi:hypothetical protein